MKPLRFRDTALAALDGVCSNSAAAHRFRFTTHSFNGYRCCPLPPLYKVLLAEPSRSVLHSELEIYYHRLLSHRAVHSHCSPAAERICRQWNTSANILRFALHGGQRHGSTSSNRSGWNRRLCQLPDLYASATPHSLCSYGVCSVARSLSRYRFVTHSFRQAAPKPTYAPTALCCRPLAPFSARA